MIVLNAGVPRSGTVLVNAILRELLRDAGGAIAQANPAGPEMPGLLRHLRDTGQERHKTVLIHTHSWDGESARLLAGSAHAVAFLNYRDPRDVCVSLMRLHDHDLDSAMTMTEGAFQHFAACARDIDAMVIPYEYLMADKRGHIFQIARHLGIWPGLERVAEIDEATSIDRHKAVMEKVQAGEIDQLNRRNNRHRVLVEDPKTLINDRHIQSGASGRWRSELDDVQQQAVTARFAQIMKRYGYGD